MLAIFMALSQAMFAQTYSTMPLSDDFSASGSSLGASFGYVSDQSMGRVDRRNLTGSWPNFAANNGSPNAGKGLAIYNASTPSGTNNIGFRIYLNLTGATSSALNFWGVDWGTSFNLHKMTVRMSSDGGSNFTTVSTVNISLAPYSDGIWNAYSLNLVSLASANGVSLTSTMVVELRFDMSRALNLASPKSWPSEGFYIDDFSVTGTQVLPVELTEFAAQKESGYNLLSWSTASEINNAFFEVEKSSDGINFHKIGQVQGAGNSSEELDYEFMDHVVNDETVYYRLKQVDFDGAFEYSPVRMLTGEGEMAQLMVLDNGGQPSLYWTSAQNTPVQIINQAGQVVYAGTIAAGYDFAGFSSGVYSVVYWNGEKPVAVKVVKQ